MAAPTHLWAKGSTHPSVSKVKTTALLLSPCSWFRFFVSFCIVLMRISSSVLFLICFESLAPWTTLWIVIINNISRYRNTEHLLVQDFWCSYVSSNWQGKLFTHSCKLKKWYQYPAVSDVINIRSPVRTENQHCLELWVMSCDCTVGDFNSSDTVGSSFHMPFPSWKWITNILETVESTKIKNCN